MLASLLTPLHDMQHAIAAALREPAGVGALALFALSVVFGAVHSLLPGHGKTVLAAHHASAGREALRWPRAVTDAVFISFARVLAAAIVVLGAAQLARLYAGENADYHGHGGTAQLIGGVVFVALGVWLVATARQHVHVDARMKGDISHRLPLLAMGLVPDPVATIVITYAAVADATIAGIIAAFGIALGMAATLLLFALMGPALAERLGRGMDEARRAAMDRWLRAIGGAVVVCVGTGLVLSA